LHISDQVLPNAIWIGGYAVTGAATALLLPKLRESDIPRLSVMTSFAFAAQSIYIPVAGGSVHLVLNGLLGIVLGWFAFPSLLISLAFQLLLLQHGGITTLGINTFNLAAGAVAARYVFAARALLPRSRWRDAAAGLAAGAAGIAVSAALYLGCLLSAGQSFRETARFAFLLHLPVLAIETLITASAVSFLLKVRPELLEGTMKR
jgi:cobalt/nickel transport system permease protein